MDLLSMLCAAVLRVGVPPTQSTTAHMSGECAYVVFINKQFSQNARN